jgi:hypothetical protein
VGLRTAAIIWIVEASTMRNAMQSDGSDEVLAGIYEKLSRHENLLLEFSRPELKRSTSLITPTSSEGLRFPVRQR